MRYENSLKSMVMVFADHGFFGLKLPALSSASVASRRLRLIAGLFFWSSNPRGTVPLVL